MSAYYALYYTHTYTVTSTKETDFNYLLITNN